MEAQQGRHPAEEPQLVVRQVAARQGESGQGELNELLEGFFLERAWVGNCVQLKKVTSIVCLGIARTVPASISWHWKHDSAFCSIWDEYLIEFICIEYDVSLPKALNF